MRHKTSYVYDIYPTFGEQSRYLKMSKSQLIAIIKRLCYKYSHVRLKFINMTTEINFLKRKNILLDEKVEFLLYRLNDTPSFKSLKSSLKNKRQRGELQWDIIKKRRGTSTHGKSSAQKASGQSGTARAARPSRGK